MEGDQIIGHGQDGMIYGQTAVAWKLLKIGCSDSDCNSTFVHLS